MKDATGKTLSIGDRVVTTRNFSCNLVPGIIEAFTKQKVRIRLTDRKSTRLNSSHIPLSRMPSSA